MFEFFNKKERQRKILLVMANDFTLGIYKEIFENAGFLVFKTNSGKEAFLLVDKEKPDVVLADVEAENISGFELLESMKKNSQTKNIPVVIFSQTDKNEDRIKAIDLEARYFISATDLTPHEVMYRIRILLGEQKTYRISIKENEFDAGKLIDDISKERKISCDKCGKPKVLFLMRDLSKGENYYKVTLVCPKCR